VVTCQLQVKHRTGKVSWQNTGVLPLCYATIPVAVKCCHHSLENQNSIKVGFEQ